MQRESDSGVPSSQAERIHAASKAAQGITLARYQIYGGHEDLIEAPGGAGTMSKKRRNRKKRMGSSIDDFMKEEGIFEEAQAQAVKEVVAWQLDEAMKKRKISKNRMATLLKTSRTQVDRLLNPKSDITLSSLQRAAAMVGRRVTIELT